MGPQDARGRSLGHGSFRRDALACLGAALLGALCAGCRAEVGECDSFAAREVVYFDSGTAASPLNGIPMYAGQALMQSSCGNGAFCHSQGAAPSERYGVPAGLDFDVGYGCEEGPCDTSEPEIARLAESQRVALDYARSILTTVSNGRMPPGGVGERIVEQGGRFRVVDIARAQSFTLFSEVLPCDHPLTSCSPGETTQEVETPLLPAVGTEEGNGILRNWLACGAPVIESTVGDLAAVPGSSCSAGSVTGHVGDCVHRILEEVVPPEPTWSAIYTEVVGPLCGASCHSGGAAIPLDLSTQQIAYDNIVEQPATGGACAGVGILVVPYESASTPNESVQSLFVDKLTPEPRCGGPMPPRGALLPAEIIDVIRQWIEAGAPND